MMRLLRARIDTAALRANLAQVRRQAPLAKVMAVIKANAYGHGLVPVAMALHEADALAVARIEEAATLRSAGMTTPIVLLEGVINAGQLAEAAQLQLELVVHEPGQIALLEEFRGPYRFPVWLKVDTGMNRLGVRTDEFRPAWERLAALSQGSRGSRGAPMLRVMTHLSCADERGNEATDEQLARLSPLLQGLHTEVSVANSAAILSRPDTHAQWVRPGLALYGAAPFPGETGATLGLRPVMSLLSTVIATRTVPRGESVGYGATWRAARASRLAIVAGGYGDGLLRSVPSGSPVLIGGRSAPLVGRVSMDMSAVDITDLPPVQVGDQVELWGRNLPVEQVAAAAGSIPYELLCGVSQRVPIELA